MIKFIVASHLFFYAATNTIADTIYQWSDPWGQIQYSKTPVPGAMVSDLTKLPEALETTEQQKQEAMVRKLQELRQKNLQRIQQQGIQERSKAQALETKNHCNHLRNLMTDIQLYNLWQNSIYGASLFTGYYGHLQYDLSKEIHSKCR
ncbi:hypothetical protein SAMN05216302_100893 [Nitrosomonas aestuarii]|uniref:DUF4124 domain-containing protein n=1 Tax=Nitrosomonas aestuarii TaxID=52441 RepID=A0A1I4ABJ5_9PROT|nr:hypothetical protein [Nitrosomonas aestuarii]SFK53166.1 hypothetical protein SAMN05216302_100893 [Nitrosomonas aestuarii]